MRITLIFSLLTLFIGRLTAQPISLHPGNPHYFDYKGKPTILVASSEHYGSVINPDFNFSKYLKTLKSLGLNHTRIWLGDYVEKPGDFCLSENTSAPLPGKFLAPWARGNEPGFAAGGNKFDLDKWNPDFFTRLHAFMQEASDNGIVVECILFFVGPNWHLLPMNPANNVNNTTTIEGRDYLTVNNGNILEHQKKLCLKIINELNQYDNFIFNIANEPWFSNQEHPGFASPPRNETKEWIRTVSDWIVNEEKNLPKQHLISIDYTNEGRIISKEEQEKYWKNISVFNHHYDKDALSVKFNYGINKVLSFNETGLMPPTTSQYRIQGWKYLMSGGALYNNLDFTFEVGSEDGSGGINFLCNGYNGCNDKGVKYEMAALLKFMNSFDFANTRPNYNVVTCAFGDQNFCVLENPGKEYVLYIYGGTNKGAIQLGLVAGKYDLFWINPSDGKILERTEIETDKSGGLQLNAPAYNEDITLLLRYQSPS
jgi:hypothetical protein